MAGPAIVAGISGAMSMASQLWGNRARGKEAQKNRDFQERMRNTEWQAAVADMEKAGINPALAYSQGGASSPTGAVAQMTDVGGEAVGTAMAVKTQAENLKLLRAQTAKVTEEAASAHSDREIRRVEEMMARGHSRMYFDINGRPTAQMRALMQAQHSASLGQSARTVHDAEYARLSISEQKAISGLFDGIGSGGAGARAAMPLLIQLLRRR